MSPLSLVLRPYPFLSYKGNASLQANCLDVFHQMLAHIYNYSYNFGAGKRREIKGILGLPDRAMTNRRVGYHYVFTSLTRCGFATGFYAK